MRVFKLAGALAAFLALAAVAAASVSAAIGFLPGAAGTTFSGTTGEFKLKSAAGTIICKSGAITGELLSSTEGTATITKKECSVAGLEVRGLVNAEKSKEVTSTAKLKVCTVSTSPLVIALDIRPEPIHIEVPAAKLLNLAEGDYLALVEPANNKGTGFTLKVAEKEGKQEDRICDGTTHNLNIKDDGGEKGEDVVILSKATLMFKVEEEWMV